MNRLNHHRRALEKFDQRLTQLLAQGNDLGGKTVNEWITSLSEIKAVLQEFNQPALHVLDLNLALVELLQARLSDRVMSILTRADTGLFPSPKEIKMNCSCPDSAGLCKHLAAVLYGVGARLDESPELLFLLRSVDYEQLIQQASDARGLTAKAAGGPELSESELEDVFGLELAARSAPPVAAPAARAQTKPLPAIKRPSSARRPGRAQKPAPAPKKIRRSPKRAAR